LDSVCVIDGDALTDVEDVEAAALRTKRLKGFDEGFWGKNGGSILRMCGSYQERRRVGLGAHSCKYGVDRPISG
jgi:hypothetical protein